MTTTVKITNENGHDVVVMTAHPETGVINGPAYKLSPGMSATLHVWADQGIAIREHAEQPLQAVSGIGQVEVQVVPTTQQTILDLVAQDEAKDTAASLPDDFPAPGCDSEGGEL